MNEVLFIIIIFLYIIGIIAIKNVVIEYKKEQIRDEEFYEKMKEDIRY